MFGHHSFPSNFTWGVATSSFQIEGAHNKDGKGSSIWDDFCRLPGRIVDNANGHIACNHYYKWEEDIKLIKELGVNAYRFSISWPRVMPLGEGKINIHGLDFYSHLVDALLTEGIEPFVTLFHWDLPSALQKKYGGWFNEFIPKTYYFKQLGRIKKAIFLFQTIGKTFPSQKPDNN